jgi:pimeloyl-[acyl-carrier protein] methyl ester esterase
VKLHVDTVGTTGPDLALLHGWAMHGGIFHGFTEALAERCRVHVVDLPGHGFSRDVEGLDIAAIAAALARQLPPSIWIGWSLGGLVAMQAAIIHADRVRGLGLIAASPRFVVADDWRHGVALDVFAKFGADLHNDYRGTLDRFLALEVHGDDQAMAGLRLLRAHLFDRGEPATAALVQGLAALEQTDLRGALPAVACPNVWIAGARDRLVPAAAMETAAKLARGRFERVPRAGHAPFITHRDAVLAHLFALIGEASA